jgi:hypothetical protein
MTIVMGLTRAFVVVEEHLEEHMAEKMPQNGRCSFNCVASAKTPRLVSSSKELEKNLKNEFIICKVFAFDLSGLFVQVNCFIDLMT